MNVREKSSQMFRCFEYSYLETVQVIKHHQGKQKSEKIRVPEFISRRDEKDNVLLVYSCTTIR